MAVTTTNTKSTTTSKYNTDFSAANAYRPDATAKQYNPELLKAGQQSIDEYAGNRGYDNIYRYNDLLDTIYNPGVEARYNQDVYGAQVAQNNYGQSMNALNRSVIDAVRGETANAIASGTSRGVTDANVLKSILGLQQESVADATELAQLYRQAEVDRGVNQAEAYINASNDAWARQNAIDAETLQLFEDMQNAYNNKYTADAALASNMYAADAEAYNNLLATLANQVLSETTEATSETLSPDVAGGYYGGNNYYNTNPDVNVAVNQLPSVARTTDKSVATKEALANTPDGKAYDTVAAAQKAADALNGGSKSGAAAKYIVTEKRGKNANGTNSKYYAIIPNPNYKETAKNPYTSPNNKAYATKKTQAYGGYNYTVYLDSNGKTVDSVREAIKVSPTDPRTASDTKRLY